MSDKAVRVRDIVKVANAKLISGNEDVEIITYSKDTRVTKEGDMYLGIRGENSDGNDYIENAFANGAVGCIVDKLPAEDVIKKYENKIIIYVEDTVKALQDIAKYKRSLFDIPVVAITGSVR